MVQSSNRTVVVGLSSSEVTLAVSDSTPVALDYVSVTGTLRDVTDNHAIAGGMVDILLLGALNQTVQCDQNGFYQTSMIFSEGHHTLQARFNGDAGHDADWSPLVAVDAWKPTTGITINVSPQSGPPPLAVAISGKITRDDTGAGIAVPIELYKNDTLVTSKYSDTVGNYSFSDTLSSTGAYTYYTLFAGNEKFQGCEGVVLQCPWCRLPINVENGVQEVTCIFCGAVSEVAPVG